MKVTKTQARASATQAPAPKRTTTTKPVARLLRASGKAHPARLVPRAIIAAALALTLTACAAGESGGGGLAQFYDGRPPTIGAPTVAAPVATAQPVPTVAAPPTSAPMPTQPAPTAPPQAQALVTTTGDSAAVDWLTFAAILGAFILFLFGVIGRGVAHRTGGKL
jgi:hypothetical protein